MNDLIVLIPCFNNETKLLKTLVSITEKVAILIIDDGSNNEISLSKIKASNNFIDLYLIRLATNQGIARALNNGLRWAEDNKYQFIARLDAGDEVIGKRFYQQQRFLTQNPNCKLLGSWANVTNSSGKNLFQLKHPVTHNEIASAIHRYNPFVHPTVMFHIDVYKALGGYPENYSALEDYAYFFLIVKNFTTANLPEVLINYVIDEHSISSQNRKKQSFNKVRLLLQYYDFSLLATVGLIKSILLCFVSRRITTWFKMILWSNQNNS